MTTQPSSRLTSTEPGPIPRDRAPVRAWGDDEAGWVNDWVYVSSARLYQIVLSMPPGASFRHSERNRTVFGADELYLVLEGSLALANPERGEVLRLDAGDAAWFGPDTWHHGFGVGDTEVKVLEYFAPPPAAGMSQDYARTRPYLEHARYADDRVLGTWPRSAPHADETLHRVVPAETLWRLEGRDQELLVGLMLSTPRLTVGTGELPPGRGSGGRSHDGDLGLFVQKGSLTVILPAGEGSDDAHRLRAWDGFFVPAGTTYRLANEGGARTSFVFGVSPNYGATIASPGRSG